MTTPPADLSRLRISRNQPAPRTSVSTVLLWVGLAAVAGVAVWYFFFRAPTAIQVTTANVEMSGGSAGGGVGITANGYVVARTRASLSSRISGRVVELTVEEGSVVQKGQLLARLESAEYVAALAQAVADSSRAEASLRDLIAQRGQVERDLTRARDLAAKDFETKRNVEDLASQLEAVQARVAGGRAQIQSASALVEIARSNLDNTSIRAPFDGTVLRKDAEVGELVAPIAAGGGLTRGAVVTMANLSTLEVEVDVNEAYIAQINRGQLTKITLDAYPTVSFAGDVRQIVPTADRQRATVQVKVRITDRDSRILPEMGARVDFLTKADSAAANAPTRLFIPATAVQSDGAETIVWLVRGDTVSRVVIDAGPVSAGKREVRKGLSGGEQVVLNPPKDIVQGARVNVSK